MHIIYLLTTTTNQNILGWKQVWKVIITCIKIWSLPWIFPLLLLAFSVSGWFIILSLLFFDLFLTKQSTTPLYTLSSTSSAFMRQLCSSVLVLLALLFINSKDESKKTWKLLTVKRLSCKWPLILFHWYSFSFPSNQTMKHF